MTREETRVLFETDTEYRKQVIRELELSGSIERLSPKDFGSLVY
jgi:hypothetical protein